MKYSTDDFFFDSIDKFLDWFEPIAYGFAKSIIFLFVPIWGIPYLIIKKQKERKDK